MYGTFWGDIKLVSLQSGEVIHLLVRDLYCLKSLFALKIFSKYFRIQFVYDLFKYMLLFGFQETASYNFHQVPIEDFQQAKVSNFLVLSAVSSIIDEDLRNFLSLIFTALCLLLYLNFFIMENNIMY